uniref:Ig-like domain-containing protein n=1 Tax=Heliothis virescens TaxID=7102 RepID=A0A2A4JSU0_HELVI
MFSLGDRVPEIKQLTVTKVPAGSTAVLNCHSNDMDHNFMFWLFNGTDVIGPGNVYNEQKYKYEVLSGKLHIHDVSARESGNYHCISKKLNGAGYTVGQVDMIVTGTAFTSIDAVKLVAIVLSIIVIIGCAVLYYNLRKDWKRYEGRAVIPVDEVEEDEGDGDEIYNRTTTPTQARQLSQPVPGPSRNQSSEHLLYGIDNQGLDTDFNSVFENIQIKSPQPSLI